jgi:glucose-1-phosphate cytidylyltransferase
MTKAVILAGGKGTRLSEETMLRPKPMVEIGGRPILWHIMKIYAAHGITEFVVCLGYKGAIIKDYFLNYRLGSSDVTFDLAEGSVTYHRAEVEPWKVTLVETGDETQTGGRLLRAARHLDPDEPFCLTYGDGVADVDIGGLLAFHAAHGKLATVTAVTPPGRFGALLMADGGVTDFVEKPAGEGGLINGGFFVLHPRVINRIEGDLTVFERGPLQGLARDGELMAFEHRRFWQPMDTLRDRDHLEALWASGRAPWKVW